MTNPLAAIQTMSRPKALFFAAGILAASLLASFALNIPAMGMTRIQTILENAGFSRVSIGAVSYDMGGLRARGITLDPYGFDRLEQLDVRLSWPSFLIGNHIREATISGLTISRTTGDRS